MLQPLDGQLGAGFVQAVDLGDERPVVVGLGDHELAVAGDQAKFGRFRPGDRTRMKSEGLPSGEAIATAFSDQRAGRRIPFQTDGQAAASAG